MDLPFDFGARHLLLIVIAVTVGGYWIATGQFVEGALLLGIIAVGVAIQIVFYYLEDAE